MESFDITRSLLYNHSLNLPPMTMFSQLSFGVVALFTCLQGVAAMPATSDAVKDTIKSPHEFLDIIEVGGLNITL